MPRIVPEDWMPRAQMRRIHLHWTAGGHKANSTDKKSYHILVQGDGTLVRGNHSIKANEAPVAGQYAPHTRKANTKAIGVSMCGMMGSRERPFDPGPAPLTEGQWEVALSVIADLAEAYSILVTPTTVLTHAEVQNALNIPQRNKWDISRLAFDDRFTTVAEVGEELRAQVAARISGGVAAQGADTELDDEVMDDIHKLPKFRVSGVAPSRLNFRNAPMGDKIGSLTERSVVERIGVFGEWWQVRTRLGFVGFVHSGFLTAV